MQIINNQAIKERYLNLNDFCKAYLLDTPGEIRRKAQETRKCTVTRT